MSSTSMHEPLRSINEPRMASLSEMTSQTMRTWWVAAARLGWAGLILLSLGLFLLSLPYRYHQLHTFTFVPLSGSDIMRVVDPEALRRALAVLGLSTGFFAWYSLALEILFATTFCAVAALIAVRRRNSWWTMFVVLMLVVFGTSSLPTITAISTLSPTIDLLTRITHMLAWALVEIFLLLFPNGRFVPRWTKPAALGWLCWMMATAIFPTTIISPFTWPDQLAFLLWAIWYGGAMLAQIHRFRHVANDVERWQTKWTLSSVVVAVIGTLLVNVPKIFTPSLTDTSIGALCELIRIPASSLAILVMPVTVGIAILRYRLWEIDVIISRTLVYVPLTAILGGLYTAGIGLSQRIFVATTGSTSDAAIVLTTLVVASAFTPIKNALQAGVDGRFKAAPSPAPTPRELHTYRVQLQTLLGALDTRQAASHLLEASMASLNAECGAVYLAREGEPNLVQTAGPWRGEAIVSLPLEWNGTQLGQIALGRPRSGQEYAAADLEEVRQTAASLAHLNVLLGEYLRPAGSAAKPEYQPA